MTIHRFRLFLVLWLLALSGCARSAPEMRSDYVGHWRGENVKLSIFADGRIAYERDNEGGKTRINAPVTEFKGDDIVVGIWFLTTTFVVSEAPHQVDGQWRMVVDGVRLTRGDSAPGSRPSPAKPKFICSSCPPFPAA